MKNKSMNKILALGVVAAMTAGMLAGVAALRPQLTALQPEQKLLLILQQAMVKYLPWYGGL